MLDAGGLVFKSFLTKNIILPQKNMKKCICIYWKSIACDNTATCKILKLKFVEEKKNIKLERKFVDFKIYKVGIQANFVYWSVLLLQAIKKTVTATISTTL